MALITQERVDEATPNGGAYSMIYYLDDCGRAIGKNLATRCEIVEYDQNDKPLFETYGVMSDGSQ